MMSLDTLTPKTSLAMMQTGKDGLGTLKSRAENLDAAKQSGQMKKIEDAAKDFESVFISEMIKPMFNGIETDGMFGGGKSEEIFRGMMIDQYGKMLSDNGGIGLADHIKEAMIQMQESSNKGANTNNE